VTRLVVIELTLVAAWIGAAAIVAAVVAPAAFKVLPTRTMAGAVVGEVLPVIFIAGLVIAAIAIGIEARSSLRAAAIVPLAAMMIACGIAQFVVAPRIEAARLSIGGQVDSVPESDPRRVRFGKLHAFSVMWMGVAMIGAGGLIGRKLYEVSS
jgi:hypothetical protein